MNCFLAVRTGLEPATSAVTGRHSNQLNYRTRLKICRIIFKCGAKIRQILVSAIALKYFLRIFGIMF